MDNAFGVKFRKTLPLIASAVLAIAGMGSNCPGTGSTANFKNTKVSELSKGSNASVSSKAWHSPVLADIGAVDVSSDCLAHDQNMSFVSGLPSPYPMSLFSDSSNSYYLFHNRFDGYTPNAACPVTSASNGFIAQNTDVSYYSSWVSNGNYGPFTQFDSTISPTATDTQRPLSVVDSLLNATVVFFSRTTAGVRGMYASRHTYGNGSWNSIEQINDNGGMIGDVLDSGAVAADVYNNIAAVWVQNGYAWFNEYRPNLGWRYSNTTFTSYMNFSPTDDGAVQDLGIDIGFDGYGNGYGVYVGSGSAIVAGRWKGNSTSRFARTTAADYQTVSVAPANNPYGWPRIFVDPNGSAYLFFYNSYAAGEAELMYASAAAPSPAYSATRSSFSAPTRFDSGYGSSTSGVYMRDFNQDFPPILASRGSHAAVAFIKNDGSARRLYVFRYSSGSWTSLGAADVGDEDVSYASISINSSDQVAVVYSAGTTEHVYANVHSQGMWQGVYQLDNTIDMTPAPAGTRPSRPVVQIDDAGTAVMAFSMDDTLFSPIRRRVWVGRYY